MMKNSESQVYLIIVNSWLIFTTIIAAINFWQIPTPWLRQGKIYVSPDGKDWQLGNSPTHAVKTLQRAADMVAAGEEIIILPGIYREKFHIRQSGQPENPITFRAQEAGTVTITNAVDPETIKSLLWRREGDGIFSTQPPWEVYRVSYKEENLYHADRGVNLDKFRALVKRKNAYGAFYYDHKIQRLYVFLPSGKSLENISIPRKVPSPDQFGNVPPAANVWVEADHIIFEGLRLKMGVGAGILLWDASNITVRDCYFTGAMYGVSSSSIAKPASNILVEHSFYHNYPQHDWYENWLTWAEVYSTGSNSSLLSLTGQGVIIRHNLVSHGGDGLQISPQTTFGNSDQSHFIGAEVYENLLFRNTDDAIEFDGLAQNIHVYRNLIYDSFVSLGLSPVLKGPVLIENNIFLHPFHPKHTTYPAHLKFLNPWFKAEDINSDRNTIRNIEVRNNTFIGNWLAWWHEAPIVDVKIHNNNFAIQRQMNPPWKKGITDINNRIIKLDTSGYSNPGTDPQWRYIHQSDHSSPWQIPQPGPGWFDYQSHPATLDIPQKISSDFFITH